MNMIVKKSDLVGYEAVDRTDAKKKALAKIVAAWESKQAKNAARFGGLGFLAVSLAACNSSSDDTATTTPTTPTTTTPTVTALSQALGTTADVITSAFTSENDSITATQATLGGGDVLVDTSSTDSDTLTVSMTTATAAAPSTITGVENVVYNYSGITAGNSTVDVANIIGANITVNHTGNAAVVDNNSTISNIGPNNTVTFGTSITMQATAGVAANATGVTINGGSGGTDQSGGAVDFQVDTGASVDGLTINGGAAGIMDINLGATNKNVTITGGSTAGTMNVDNASATGTTVTSGAADTQLVVTNIATNANVTFAKAGTTTTPADLQVGGTAVTTDAATVSAAGAVTFDSNAGGQQVESLTLTGNGAAATYTLNAGDTPSTIIFSGSQSVTLVVDETQAGTNITTVTDNTTAGTTTIKTGALANTLDLKALDADILDIGGAVTAAKILTFKDGQEVTISAAQGAAFEIDVDDGATTNTTAGTLTLNVAADMTTVNVDTDNDVIKTLTVVNSKSTNTAPHTYDIIDDTATEDLVINMSGTAVTMTTATEASELNASAMTGNLTAVLTVDKLMKVTGGSGDDTFTGFAKVGTEAVTVDGGSGNDTFVTVAGDMSNTTLSGIEVIDITAGNAAFKASALSGKSFIIKNDDATDQLQINAAALVDISNINLSTLSFNNDALVTVTLTNFDTSKLLSGQSFTVTGTSQKDTITGSANADTIDGGAGDDTLIGAAGADDITGGAGADTITGGAGADTVTTGAGADTVVVDEDDTSAALTAATVTITDFTVGAAGDQISFINNGDADTNITFEANAVTATAGEAGIATAGKIATFHADDDTLAERLVAVAKAVTDGGGPAETEGEAVMFTHGGTSYIFISDGDAGNTAGDNLIALTGIDFSSTTSDEMVAVGGDITLQ